MPRAATGNVGAGRATTTSPIPAAAEAPGSARATPTDPSLAVGSVRAAAGADSSHLADAHVVAAAVEAGGGVVLTGDEDDLGLLAAAYPNVHVSTI